MTTVREDEQFIYVTPFTKWELSQITQEWAGA